MMRIDLLQPHILFLNNAGMTFTPVNKWIGGVELCEAKHFDVVLSGMNTCRVMSGLDGPQLIQKQ